MVCQPLDVACGFREAIIGIVVPYVLPIIILLVALLILPRAGRKGWLAALLVVAGVVTWYLGIPGLMPPLRGAFGY